jgi:hypothetical protein
VIVIKRSPVSNKRVTRIFMDHGVEVFLNFLEAGRAGLVRVFINS